MTRYLLVNGPNLNTLGTREPHIYGTTTLDEVVRRCTSIAGEAGATLTAFQSNHEGALIDFLQEQAGADGAIINPGGLAHTSVALRDAVAGCAFPVVEVHISNPSAREAFRHPMITATAAVRVIAGKGLEGYLEALDFVRNGKL